MKKRTIFIAIVLALLFTIFDFLNPDLSYKEEYHGDTNINIYKDAGKEFDVGLNKYGDIVFKSPNLAFNKLKKDYKDGILLIKEENNLEDLSFSNYKLYMKYGCQVTNGTSEEMEQARFVCLVLDIYENSFKDFLELENFWDRLWTV